MYRHGKDSYTSQDGQTVFHTHSVWGYHRIYKASNVLCADGKRRTVYLREPDTFFSIPGFTKARGKTISGFLTTEGYGDNERYVFVATGKNLAAIDDYAPVVVTDPGHVDHDKIGRVVWNWCGQVAVRFPDFPHNVILSPGQYALA